jgi:hypothetical protein
MSVSEKKRYASPENRTRGHCLEGSDFTTKPATHLVVIRKCALSKCESRNAVTLLTKEIPETIGEWKCSLGVGEQSDWAEHM